MIFINICKEKNIKIKITTTQYDAYGSIADSFDEDDWEEEDNPKGNPTSVPDNKIEIITDGKIVEEDGKISLSYEETELTEMDGSITTVSFSAQNPGLVTMFRTGTISTLFVFEENQRHISTYDNPFMPFELCVCTQKVKNALNFQGGILELHYYVEFHGEKAEQNHLLLSVFDAE